jgi:DNA-binding GntR family transcriptional regulator
VPYADTSPWRRRFNTTYKTIREQIILHKYPPGTRLNIDTLASEFSVSRTPIRTVLQRLENEGLAITRHGVGTTVTEIDFDRVRDAMLLRMHLAELIGTLNPQPPDDTTLELLGRLKRECSPADVAPLPEKFARIDTQLHDCKCSLVGNELLRRTYDEMYYRTVRTWFYFLPRMDWAREYSLLSEDINMTTNALKRGDIAAVGFVTRNAISAGLYRLNDLIKEAEVK